MRRTLRIGYEKLKNDGMTQVCRAASRLVTRKYYDWQNGVAYNTDGVDIHEQDWDNLLILDACRFDYFDRYNEIDGDLQSRQSRGSTSREFIRGNFSNRRAYDTV
jgi:hypothetical protein